MEEETFDELGLKEKGIVVEEEEEEVLVSTALSPPVGLTYTTDDLRTLIGEDGSECR